MPLVKARPIYRIPEVMTAQSKVNTALMMPPPIGGLDTSTALVGMDVKSAIVSTNVFNRRFGNELRPGYLRWTTGIAGAVLTIMPYQGPRGTVAPQYSRLFAAASDGNVYDVTDRTDEVTPPTLAVTMPGQLSPGEMSFTQFATAANNYLVVVNAGYGVITYDTVGGWVPRTITYDDGGGGGPVDIGTELDFVMAWKNRLWFVKNNTSEAYYLPVNSISGEAKLFDFGPLFVHGGDLKALASWTIDAGDGMDDKLVVTSEGGDILVYAGTDPEGADTFGIQGRWYAGRPPAGRRFMSKYGGDLAFITERGIQFMSQLLAAQAAEDPTVLKNAAYRYNEVISQQVRDTRDQLFWRLIFLPAEESAIVVTPHNVGAGATQHVLSTVAEAWSTFKNMPMLGADVFQGDLYFGTTDGRVCKAFYGDTDDELTDGTPGSTVIADIQTAFVAPQDDRINLKRSQLVQVMFQAPGVPSVLVRINHEWAITPADGAPIFTGASFGLWDISKWDQAVWAGTKDSYSAWVGVEGVGVFASLRLAFTGAPRTLFTAWKYVFEGGRGLM